MRKGGVTSVRWVGNSESIWFGVGGQEAESKCGEWRGVSWYAWYWIGREEIGLCDMRMQNMRTCSLMAGAEVAENVGL